MSLFNTFVNMSGTLHRGLKIQKKYFVSDMKDCYICSFTEFAPFCFKLYYFSNFKDFNSSTQA